MSKTFKCKCVLLGYQNTGKSCLVDRYVNDKFDNISQATIGCAFSLKHYFIDNSKVVFEIWDTAGNEKYFSILPMYFRNSDIILICIDLSNSDNIMNEIDYWIEYIDNIIDISSKIICIVGTKSDIKKTNFQNKDIIEEKYPDLFYIETSAKNNFNIDNLFSHCAQEVIKQNEALKNDIDLYAPFIIETESSCIDKCKMS